MAKSARGKKQEAEQRGVNPIVRFVRGVANQSRVSRDERPAKEPSANDPANNARRDSVAAQSPAKTAFEKAILALKQAHNNGNSQRTSASLNSWSYLAATQDRASDQDQNRHAATLRFERSKKMFDQRGFARPIFSNQSQHTTLRDKHRNIVKRRRRAEMTR
jgi:hypothetical protein